MEDKNTIMTFKQIVEKTPDIKDGFHRGLQALRANAKQVSAADTQKLEGSVDIDACTKNIYPQDSRWDYAIGYGGKVYFLEIHPANTSNIKEMIKKAEWLKNWLAQKAPLLKSRAVNSYYWKASGKFNILPNSLQNRKLAQSKIKLISNCKLPL